MNTRFQGPGQHVARARDSKESTSAQGHQGERKNSGFERPCHSSYSDGCYCHPGQQLANVPAMRHLDGEIIVQ